VVIFSTMTNRRRRSRLEHVADRALELDAQLELRHQPDEGAEPGVHGQAQHGDEEQEAEQQPPEHAPRRPRGHLVVGGLHVEPAFLVPADDDDGVGLDD
jgi:hypothetical protein